jgi:hypothetical protein
MGVEAKIGDAIAVFDSVFVERRCEAFRPFTEFAIGELALARNDPDLVGE